MLETRQPGVRWMRALVVAVALAPQAAFAGVVPYELVFVSPTPLPPNVNEGSTVTVGVELQLGCDPFSAVTWQATATAGTATAGIDFMQPMPSALTFTGPNGRFVTFDLMIPDDLLVEGPETFDVRLTPMGNVDLDCFASPVPPNAMEFGITFTIIDDDVTPPSTVSIDSLQIEEGDGVGNPRVALFTVSLSAPSRIDVEIPFRTLDGTAIAGEDYYRRQGTVIIPPGELTSSIFVPIVGDTDFEPDETFLVRLQAPVGAILGETSGLATIVNDDQEEQDLPTVSIDDVEIVEGDAGGTAGGSVARFTVSLSFAADQPVRVPFQTIEGTATATEDFVARTGEVTFAPGEITRPINVTIVGDLIFEPDETFAVELATPQGATLERGLGTATIVNDDAPPDLPMLTINDVTVTEGDTGTRNAIFTVSLDPLSEVDVQVQATTRAGTATQGTDFTAVDTTLTIAAGARTATVAVPVIGDTDVEDDETFFLMLRQPVAAAIADAEGRGLITDDDPPVVTLPTLSIGDAQVQERDEGGRVAVFRVRLSSSSETPVRLSARTRDGTATVADQDYRARNEQLVLAPGQLETTFSVLVIGDRRVEPDERFGVELSNVVGAVLTDAMAVGTIVNDDQAPSPTPPATSFVRLLSTPPVIESDGRATVTVERQGDVSGPAQVMVVVAAGSARAGEDFVAVQRRLRWAPGEGGTRQFAFSIRDDDQAEADETVAVSLTEPVGVGLGTPARIEVVIVDNDTATRAEAIIDQEITSRTRREVELSVRTVRPDGTPVPGAPVRWRLVSGTAELLGNPERRTDSEGITRLTVRLGRRPGKVVVAVELIGQGAELAFSIRVDGDFGDLVDPTLAPNDAGLAGLLDGACTDATEGELAELCAFLFDLESDDERRRALQALRPDGAAALADRGLRGPRVQHRNLNARLQTLRGGQTQRALNQLALSLRGQSLTVGGVRQAFSSPGDDQQWLARIDRVLAAAVSGPAVSASARDLPAEGAPETGADTASQPLDTEPFDLGSSRWGVFLNGRISIGDAPRTQRQAGYEFETEGLTGGVDYRLNERLVIGGALGYLRSDTELGLGRGEIDVEGLSLSGYFTYYRQRFYIDGIVGIGKNEYQTSRVIVLPRAFRGSSRLVARSDPDGSQLSVNVGVGYDLLNGALGLQGFARAAYTRAEIDAYSEEGAGPLSLTFGDQAQDSLLAEAGLELSYPFSFRWGVLQPSLRLAYLRELADDSRTFEVGLQVDAGRRRYRNQTDVPDRSFLNIGAAITATFIHGWASYLQYDTDAARDDFDVYTLSFGVRKQL